MKCESCNKKHANVHITEIHGEKKKERHLCEDCAQSVSSGITKMPSPSDILTNLISQVAPEIGEMSKIVCPVCNISYLEFRSQGRLGCPMDYTAFEKGLIPLLEKMHGSSQHIGKVPPSAGKEVAKKNRLLQLRKDLNSAVENENYEDAATIRDQINKLTGKPDGTK
ncbi:MAG: UvrB/UvrC motif-containing protein [Candidatus Anammoxibacter sp.]